MRNFPYVLKRLSKISPSGRLLFESLSIWSDRHDLVGSFHTTISTNAIQSNAASTDTPPSTSNNIQSQRLRDTRTTNILKYLLRLHLALFFFNSKYVSMLHRLTGLSYRRQRRCIQEDSQSVINSENSNSKGNRPSYKFIAYLIALEGVLKLSQVVTTLSVQGWEILSNWLDCSLKSRTAIVHQPRSMQIILDEFAPSIKSKQAIEANHQYIPPHHQATQLVDSTLRSSCGVCLNICENPAVASTRCGHLFCWECILNWTVNVRPECPLCRKQCRPQDVMALYNW